MDSDYLDLGLVNVVIAFTLAAVLLVRSFSNKQSLLIRSDQLSSGKQNNVTVS